MVNVIIENDYGGARDSSLWSICAGCHLNSCFARELDFPGPGTTGRLRLFF